MKKLLPNIENRNFHYSKTTIISNQRLPNLNYSKNIDNQTKQHNFHCASNQKVVSISQHSCKYILNRSQQFNNKQSSFHYTIHNDNSHQNSRQKSQQKYMSLTSPYSICINKKNHSKKNQLNGFKVNRNKIPRKGHMKIINNELNNNQDAKIEYNGRIKFQKVVKLIDLNPFLGRKKITNNKYKERKIQDHANILMDDIKQEQLHASYNIPKKQRLKKTVRISLSKNQQYQNAHSGSVKDEQQSLIKDGACSIYQYCNIKTEQSISKLIYKKMNKLLRKGIIASTKELPIQHFRRSKYNNNSKSSLTSSIQSVSSLKLTENNITFNTQKKLRASTFFLYNIDIKPKRKSIHNLVSIQQKSSPTISSKSSSSISSSQKQNIKKQNINQHKQSLISEISINKELISNKSEEQIPRTKNWKRAKILDYLYNLHKNYEIQRYKYNPQCPLNTHNLIYTQKELSFNNISEMLQQSEYQRQKLCIKLVFSIDRFLIERIIQSKNEYSQINGIWLYCNGVWRSFVYENTNKNTVELICKALSKASLQYFKSRCENLQIHQLIRFLTGFKVEYIERQSYKKTCSQIENFKKKGYTITGITNKKQIYEIQQIQKNKNENGYVVKISQNKSFFWIREEAFLKLFKHIVGIFYKSPFYWTAQPIQKPAERNILYRLIAPKVASGYLTINYFSNNKSLPCSMSLYRQYKQQGGYFLKLESYFNNKSGKKPESINALRQTGNYLPISKRTIKISNKNQSNNNLKNDSKKMIISANDNYEWNSDADLQVTLKGSYFLLISCECNEANLSFQGSEKIQISIVDLVRPELGIGSQFEENWRKCMKKQQQTFRN